ncbi:MAG: hypothetical protein ACRENA_12810 [Vulcanimicrobiaceae bacterium]
MRRIIFWAMHTALEHADLVLSGMPIPAIVAVRAFAIARERLGRAPGYAGISR